MRAWFQDRMASRGFRRPTENTGRPGPSTGTIVWLVVGLLAAGPRLGSAASHPTEMGAFVVEHEVVVPGDPGTIYDAITGDISGWWDHSFSESPYRLYIEARPGGGFYEIMNESGDGVLHATVIFAERGKLLRFVGPLGLSGNAIELVTTYTFAAVGADSTRIGLSVHGAGELEAGWTDAVDRTWHHFLIEQFKPYVESGKHLEK